MGKSDKIQASVWEAVQHYRQVGEATLWQDEAFHDALANAENAAKSLAVLKKHVPKRFHSLIRFAQPKTIWYLNVQKSLTANQLNLLLDDLLLRIAKDIGYAPRLRVMVKPSHSDWIRAGLPLTYEAVVKTPLPTTKEAEAIISAFLQQP